MMRVSRIASWFAALGFALFAPAWGQTGHPAKGSWVGYWGPGEKEQRRVVVDLDWRDRQIVGQLNPGPKAAPVKRAHIDYDTWTMTIEAELPDKSGKPVKWVATGKLENLGSWQNRRYSGTYQHGAESGKFSIALH